MQVTILIGLVLFVVCIVLLLKFIKNVMAAGISIFLLSIVFVAAIGFFVYGEAMELKDNFPSSPNLLLLTKDNEVLTGFVMLPADKFDPLDSLKPLTAEQISSLSEKFSSGNNKELMDVVKAVDFMSETDLQENEFSNEVYKVIFFDYEMFENSPVAEFDMSAMLNADDPVTGSIGMLDNQILLDLMVSDDSWTTLSTYLVENMEFDVDKFLASSDEELPAGISPEDVEITVEQKQELVDDYIVDALRNNLNEMFGTDDLKSMAFLMEVGIIAKASDNEGIKYLFASYKDRNIDVYPGSVILDLLRLSPKSLIDKVASEVTNTVGEISIN